MADRDEEPQLDDQEVDGGAVKSFLEHLEDLRWVLIKSGAALLLALIVCLFGVNKIIYIFKWPLQRAAARHIMLLSDNTNQTVTVRIGDLSLGQFKPGTNRFGGIDLGTNQYVTLQLEPVEEGGRQMLMAHLAPNTNDVGAIPPLVFFGVAAPFLSAMHV